MNDDLSVMMSRRWWCRWSCVCLGLLLYAAPCVAKAPALWLDLIDRKQVTHPLLVRYSSSKRSDERWKAARAYGMIRRPEGVPVLLGLLQDKDVEVREAAAFSLGQLAWKPGLSGALRKQAIQALKASIQRESLLPVRLSALVAYGKYGPKDAEAFLAPLLKQSKVDVLRAYAVMALFRAKMRRWPHKMKAGTPLKDVNFKIIAGLSQDRSVLVRETVAYFFARLKDPRALALLIQLASDKARWVRLFALQGLAKIKDRKALKVVWEGLYAKHYTLRVAAIQAIAAMKKASALPTSLLQRDASYHVRLALVKAYAQVSPKHKKPLAKAQLLASLLLQHDPSMVVRAAAIQGLARLQHPLAQQFVAQSLASKSWVLREGAVLAMRRMKKKPLALLLKAQQDPDVRVRAAAIQVSGAMPGKQAYEALKTSLASRELAERGWAVEMLAKRKEASVARVARAVYLHSLGRRWVEVRENLIGIWAKRPGTESRRFLTAALRDPAPSVARRAREALKALRAKAASRPTSRPVSARTATSRPSTKSLGQSTTKKAVARAATAKKATAKKATTRPGIAKKAAKLTFSPYRHLRFAQDPWVIVETNRGRIVIRCFAQSAPLHVANFIGNVKAGLYRGLSFHRVISNFVVQGGDPDGTGWGDAGYAVRAEINPEPFTRGTLGMPRAQGWDTGGVQLFISLVPTPHLDGRYTVFGRVVHGLDVMDRIQRGDVIQRAYVLRMPGAIPPTPRR